MQQSLDQNSFSSSKLTIFLTLMLCPFLMGVDFLGIGVALPYITHYFSLHDSTTHWMITLFAIGYVSFIVTSSRLADLYGRRRLFVWSVFLFALSSLLVGLAFNFVMVLAGRLLQGIAAGAMIMVVIALISSIFTGEQRKNQTSTLVAMFGLGTGVGPLLGGILIHYFSWRYLFFINVPIALMVCLLTLWKMPNIKPAVSKVGLDLPGMLLLSVSLSTFALVVSQASLWGYASATTLVLAAVFFLLLIVFCLVESKSSHPLVDFNLFKTKNFLAANLIGILLYVCLSSWIICSGLYFSQALRYKAFYVGLTYLPFGVSLFVVNLFVPKLNTRFSTRFLLLVAAVIGLIGFIVMAGAIYNSLGIIIYSFGTLLFGVGYVLINSLSVQLGLAFFADEKINIASGLSMMLRWVGAAIGPPVLTTVFVAIAATSGFNIALSQCYLILSIIMLLLWLVVLFSNK